MDRKQKNSSSYTLKHTKYIDIIMMMNICIFYIRLSELYRNIVDGMSNDDSWAPGTK